MNSILIKHRVPWSNERNSKIDEIAKKFNGVVAEETGTDLDAFRCEFTFPNKVNAMSFYEELRKNKMINKKFSISENHE